jgi:hypothetical protein
VTLPIPQAWLEPLAVGLDEVEDASREFNLNQIVSRPPDHCDSVVQHRYGYRLAAD